MTRNRLLTLSVLVMFAGLVGLAGCGTATDSKARVAASGKTTTAPGGSGSATDRTTAPDFELTSIRGGDVALNDSDGQVRLIDFWATWCAPCREEIPMLNDLHHEYGSRGLTILAIAEEDPEMVREFIEENDVAYTNLIDTGEITQKYFVLGLPTAFLVDGKGQIVERFTGPKPRRVLEKKIQELLAAEQT